MTTALAEPRLLIRKIPAVDYLRASLDELAARVVESDSRAFEELFERLREPLFVYARRLAPAGDAYDVLQDVFLKLWETRRDLEIRVGIQPLLYRMVRNRALNLTRKMARVQLPGDLPDVAIPAREEENAAAAELAANLKAWIGALPPRRAEAFSLSRYHGLSHEEISRIMELSVRTVQTHIVHALKDLRSAMKSWESRDGAWS